MNGIKTTLKEIDPELLDKMYSETDFLQSIPIEQDLPLAHLWGIREHHKLVWSGFGISKETRSKLSDLLDEFHKQHNKPIQEVDLPEDKAWHKEAVAEILKKDHGLTGDRATIAGLYYFWSGKEGAIMSMLKEKGITNNDVELFFQ